MARSRWRHAMQSWEWGEFKRSLGWHVERIAIKRHEQIVAGAQLLFKPLPLIPLTVAYVPKGPMVDLADTAIANQLFAAIHQVARRRRAIFLKIEPNLLDDAGANALLRQHGFQPSSSTNQPRCTIIIDLTQSEQVLLASMRKKTRKLIRRSVQEGVTVEEGDASDLDALYRMMSFAAARKGHSIQEEDYYRKEWEAFRPTDRVRMLLAKYQGETVAAKMILVFDDTSMHLWGGVSEKGRQVYANYLLQWEAIRWAKQCGYRYCDLWGIPDQVGAMLDLGQEIPKDRRNGLWGTYIFKRGFGGEIAYFVGAYDYPYRPALYWLGMRVVVRDRSVAQVSGWLEKVFGS